MITRAPLPLLAASLALATLPVTTPAQNTNPASSPLAQKILDHSQLNRGLCAILGGDTALPLELARASELLVHVRHPSLDTVTNLRNQAVEAGLNLQRLAAEHGSPNDLPYTNNTVDIIVCPDLSSNDTAQKILNALRPGGIAFISAAQLGSPATLEDTLAAHNITPKTWTLDNITWLEFQKPSLTGVDEWSHWEKTPDNNPVSDDALIKAPYMTQFMAAPYYIGMPAITTIAGGRTFLAMGHIAHHEREWEMLNRLVARNGYNGIVLWERELPDDYLVHRSAFIATDDTFYMMDGNRCLLLDAATGADKGELRIPGVDGQWKWMGMIDDTLYVLAGEPGPGAEIVRGNRSMGGWSWQDLSAGYYGQRIPHGFGDTLAAYDLKEETLLWKHVEKTPIDSRGMAAKDDRLFLYCPDHHFRALDRLTGKPAWTNKDPRTLELIEEPGRGLTSTPGWRTQSLIVATPKALVIQGQTRMNVIGLSPQNGQLLWTKQKITNNPNALFIEGNVIVGVGKNGTHVALDPVSGEVVENLNFAKRACTRLTASTDSLFVRGEGMLRFDRNTNEVTVDGAVRPACNDGVIPANGLIYLGPWACDCNLSLIGNVARCSAGDFNFSQVTDPDRQLFTPGSNTKIKPFPVTWADWPTYRANNHRSASTPVRVGPNQTPAWEFSPAQPFTPTEVTAANGLLFFGGDDGIVRALDAQTGDTRWTFPTGGVIKYPPTIARNRAYFGSGDGHAYCVEADSGCLLWRFRPAPAVRHLMIYGTLSSTWPVNTGVLVHDDTAYFAAGIVDHDGTYVCALDADTGTLRWQNTASGHLNSDLRKGVSAQGNLTIADGNLVLAGGNVVSPATYNLETGECFNPAPKGGQPQSNAGKFVGSYNDDFVINGGRILYSSPRNVSTKGSFNISTTRGRGLTLNYGGIPPAWNNDLLVLANFKYGSVTAIDAETLSERLAEGFQPDATPRNRFRNNLATFFSSRAEERWQSDVGNFDNFEPVSLVLTPNAAITVAKFQTLTSARGRWYLTAFTPDEGRQTFQIQLDREPLPGGLAVDRDGRVIVTFLDGSLAAFARRPPAA
ncbi:MAG: PQQ-binding-like beta-propeller repeat protein [Verrucomicrobiota bacterium]